jgi:RHS repeat-associated protein
MLNRPKVVTWADTSTTTLTWDAGNRLTQLVDTISGTITRSWDDLDRLSFEQTPQGRIDYTYDNAGRRQTMTVLGQPSVVYGWDDADRLQSVTQGAAVVLLGYDNANRRTTVTFPNGILATSGYDARDLTGITFTKGAATLGTLTYTTDADGRRSLVGGTWARTTLPPALTSATYNANNQQVQVGPTVLTYDLNGNLATDGAATYTWDARDRLAATSAGSATFQYDPLGRRTRKIVSATTRRFHYDGVNPVQELDGTGGILANLLTGLGIDEYFTRSDSTGTRTLLGDALNSTLALANNAGTVRTTYTYEPFGTSSVTGQANTNSYQYTARENDGTGLDYYRARYYSPSRQRFISEDPLLTTGNCYGYVRNDPLGAVDPLGLYSLLDLAGICYNESAGLRAFSEATRLQLREARTAMIHVALNRVAVGDRSPIAPTSVPVSEWARIQSGSYPPAGAAWADCVTAAALVLAGRYRQEPDPTRGALHFIQDYGQAKPSWAQGAPRLEFGPFYNAARGHVPLGRWVPIQIYP